MGLKRKAPQNALRAASTKDGETQIAYMEGCIKSYDENALPLLIALKRLKGIEAWIGDAKMKEYFQKTVYPILDEHEELIND